MTSATSTPTVKPVPDDYPGVTPYLCLDNAAGAIDFYQRAFNARELMRLATPEGRIGHAELQIAGARIMLSDECPEMKSRSPQALGGSAVALHLYVEDVDAVAEQAIAAGVTVLSPVEDQFYGDRSCQLQDPFGHIWSIATHKEDIPPAEMERRVAAMAGGQS